MADILDIAKRRGFFWQSSLIHGGIAGFYDYAHLGTAMKRKWENLWREFFIGLDENFYEIEPSVVMPENVFKASGHLKHFVDPVVKCKKCGTPERADHIMESFLGESFEGLTAEELTKLIKKHNVKCPKCKGSLEKAGVFNMLFPLNVGAGKSVAKAYLTGETAQGVYVNFKLEFDALRRKLPMGIAVIGKAFRNEISPRNAIIRMREFNQAELQIFFDPDTITEHPRFKEIQNYKLLIRPVKNKKSGKVNEILCKDVVSKMKLPKFYVYYMAKAQQFYLDILQIPKKKFRFRELSEEERAFYNKYHFDVEIDLDTLGGFREVAGIHYRTDHDLKGHQEVSGEKMVVNLDGKNILCHVLELSFGVDRNIYALMDISFREEKNRTVLSFPGPVTPIDVGIFPLVNKDRLPEKALEIKNILRGSGLSIFYDDSGSIGRRYRRMDEAGTGLCITIDHQTLKDKTVTVRDRDTMKQIRVKIDKLEKAIKDLIGNDIKFEKAGKPIKPKTSKAS